MAASSHSLFPLLLIGRPESERQRWARWILETDSDEFIPEMVRAVEQLDLQDPVCHGEPITTPGGHSEDLVVIACQGGRHCVVFDQPLPCRVVLFDWTGEGLIDGSNPQGFEVLSVATECKGHLIEEVWRRLPLPPTNHYIGIIDDDVLLRASDIRTLLAVARIHNLSALQPAVSLSSSLSLEYDWLRQRIGSTLHRVPIVEIMAPFIRRDLFDLAMPFAVGVRSGYGFDRFALPVCAAQLNAWRFAAVDCVPMSHVRLLSSVQKRFSNGLMSKEEELLVRERLVRAIGFSVDEAEYQRLERAVTGSLSDQKL